MADTLTSTPLNMPKAHAQSDSRPTQGARSANAAPGVKPDVKVASPAPLVKATPARKQPNTAAISKSATKTAKSAKPRDVKTRDAKTRDAKTKEKQLTVQEQLTKFEARVKRNNNAARKSIKELEILVDAIDAQGKTDRKSSKAALTRQINALNKKFTSMMAQSQAEIALKLTKDLAAYVRPNMAQGHNPNQYEVLSQVEIALDRANHRLSQSERAQSEAITKVNRHLADMALAIEARFEQNNNDQSKTLTALTRQITSAVDVKITAVKTELQSEFSEKFNRHDVTNKDNKAEWEHVTQDVTQLSQKITGFETATTKTLQEIDIRFDSMDAGISEQIDGQQAYTDKQISDQLEQLKTFTQSELKIIPRSFQIHYKIISRSPENNSKIIPKSFQYHASKKLYQKYFKTTQK